MAQQPNPHNAQLANLEPGEAATTAVTILTRATINTAKAHPKITGSWMLGLALVVFATGFRVSDEVASQYEADVQAADLSEPISRAAARVRRARSAHARRRPTNRFGQIRGLDVLLILRGNCVRHPKPRREDDQRQSQHPGARDLGMGPGGVYRGLGEDGHGGRRGLAGLEVRELGVVGVGLLGHGWSRCDFWTRGALAAVAAFLDAWILIAAVDAVDAAAAWRGARSCAWEGTDARDAFSEGACG